MVSMTAQEEALGPVAAVFAVSVKKWNDQNYPYYETVSMWTDHIKAFKTIEGASNLDKHRIVLRHLVILDSGRIVWRDILDVYDNGEWVSDDHDPRCSDPEFREYLRLRKKFE